MACNVYHLLELSDEEMICLWALLTLLDVAGKLDKPEQSILLKVEKMCQR